MRLSAPTGSAAGSYLCISLRTRPNLRAGRHYLPWRAQICVAEVDVRSPESRSGLVRSREDEVVAHQVRISRQADGVVSSACVVVDGLGVESPSFPLDEQTQLFLASVIAEEPALRGRLYVKSLEPGVDGQLDELAASLVETIREEEFWRDDDGRDCRSAQTWDDGTG